jgi:ferredoxin-nitrate reductase
MAETQTICPYCGVGCGVVATVEHGRLRAVRGAELYPVNEGRTCRKPIELPAAVHARDRATVPLTRSGRNVRFQETTWDAVMLDLAGRFRAVIDEHGPGAVAFYISGQLLTEDYYVVNKLAKGFLGTNNVDSNSRLCMSSAVAGYTGAFGSDGPPPSYADIEEADCFFLLGTNTAECHPIVWSRIRARQEQGASVICVDPRPTQTSIGSDLHLAVKPGTDLALLNAMLHVIDADGMVDAAFVAAHTSGWEETLEVARAWPPERAAATCGVPAADIVAAAHRFAGARSALALWSMGANQSTVGTMKNRALVNLCLSAGQIGRPGAGPLSLTGQPNAMGGRETGGLAHLLPGYRVIESDADRADLERHWGLESGAISPRPGLHAVELFDALEAGSVKAVWIVATNPIVSMPDASRARAALEAAELVVCQDAYHPTETGALAHVVLPAAAWPEKTGTMTNSERRIGFVEAALPPPGEARPDWRIFAHLAAELGFGEQFAWRDESEVFAEFAACTSGRVCDISGLDHERLRRERSAQWPVPAPESRGTERLYEGHRYPTPDGRARFGPTPHQAPAEEASPEFPIQLTTGRIADQWHTMTRTGKSAALTQGAPEPFVQLSSDDAAAARVSDGDLVRVVSRRGDVRLRARVVEGLARGVAFAPFHWGGRHAPPGSGTVNTTTIGAYDPISRQPELKALAVRVEPIVPPSRSIRRAERHLVVVGSGMAALEVVEELGRRQAEQPWRVTVLGEEPEPVYNRILLSKLLAGGCEPGDLELRPVRWYEETGVDLRVNTPAIRVDPRRKLVVDGRGGTHAYDDLVLATGSRPLRPPISGSRQPHVFQFRTQRDVERIAKRARRARYAVVVGGGLLGLEAAAGLRARGVDVTVVEAVSHLMPQQLDAGGAAILERGLRELGIASVVGSSVATIWLDRVKLQNGQELRADLVVIAAGIRPETSLAREAGIDVGRGILVDDAMRTSAPDVFAIGECAEHRGTVYGLWAPLAEQARAAGASLAGDPGAFVGAVTSTTLKVAGVDVFAGGRRNADDGEDEVAWSDGRTGVYRKLVLAGDRLAGAVLVGDTTRARELSALLQTGGPCPPHVLDPAVAFEPLEAADTDVVCSCNAITRGSILEAIRGGGLTSVAQVARATRASTGCGSCSRDVEGLLESA